VNASKVRFDLDSAIYRTEPGAPYTLSGDFNGNYWPCSYTIAPHTLSVKALNSTTAIIYSYDISFTVVARVTTVSDFSHALPGGPYTVSFIVIV
jgi:hypothetical protein